MAHDHVYLICENKCLVEGVPKSQYDSDIEGVNDSIDNIENALTELVEIETRQRAGSVITVNVPKTFNKKRCILNNNNGSTLPVHIATEQDDDNDYIVKVTWIKLTNNNTTQSVKILSVNHEGYVDVVTMDANSMYYFEIETLIINPSAE